MAAENTTAHSEAPGSPHKPAFPPFERETFPSQLLWLAICFIALYVMTARLVRPRVSGIIASRKDRISADLAEATRFKGQSDEAIAAYEKALADARARAQAIANETRDRLQAEADRERKTLEEQLNVRLAEAEKAIAATRTAAMANVRGIAAEAVAAIVARLTGITVPEPTVATALDAVLKPGM
jgi:F-type H+-transporting ATPase subunit b